jgi:2'-5' RNA ligase
MSERASFVESVAIGKNGIKMAGKRIFAAIDISDEARNAVAEYMEELGSGVANFRTGWEKPEKLHLTLKFFGAVDDARIPQIGTVLDEISAAHMPFVAELAETGVFPNSRKPRVLWLGIQNDSGKIAKIGNEIETAASRLGFTSEKRPFSPHLTIARIREPEKGKRLAEAHLQGRFGPIQFPVNELVLYESVLRSTGSIYRVVSRHAM